MEVLNGALKKYLNLSIVGILLFSLLGFGIYYLLKSPLIPYSSVELNTFPNNIFFILLWFLAFLITERLIGGFIRMVLSFWAYEFKSRDWPKKWRYQGNIRLGEEDNALSVTDSNSGGILKNRFWKNLEMSFECKFPNGVDDQTVGIIFRGQNLANYLMIQINHKEKYIMPHIRMGGLWETIRRPNYEFNLERNSFFTVRLVVIDEKVELYINRNQCLEWYIPTNSDLTNLDPDTKFIDKIIPKIDFRKSYGMVGFRAYPGESAVIRNLKIKRIPNIF